VEHGRILNVVKRVVREAPRNPPDTFQSAARYQLATAYPLCGEKFLSPIRRQIRREINVNANEKFDRITTPLSGSPACCLCQVLEYTPCFTDRSGGRIIYQFAELWSSQSYRPRKSLTRMRTMSRSAGSNCFRHLTVEPARYTTLTGNSVMRPWNF
jgi:hypothetical protein